MPDPTNVPAAQPQIITIDELYRRKGEIVTQLELAQGQLQLINQQLQQILSTQAIAK